VKFLLFGKPKPEPMPESITRLQHFPLSAAYLCEDCRHVGNSSRVCPSCASTALSSLANAERDRQTEVVFVSGHGMKPIAVAA
jgi:hypothetical protein